MGQGASVWAKPALTPADLSRFRLPRVSNIRVPSALDVPLGYPSARLWWLDLRCPLVATLRCLLRCRNRTGQYHAFSARVLTRTKCSRTLYRLRGLPYPRRPTLLLFVGCGPRSDVDEPIDVWQGRAPERGRLQNNPESSRLPRADNLPAVRYDRHCVVWTLVVSQGVGSCETMVFRDRGALPRERYDAAAHRRRYGQRRGSAGCGRPVTNTSSPPREEDLD